ncbi:gamma-glutamyl-gamma-aminobutyrate hydrolase family protein [Roseateles toxinivorans]|uniref:Putative glutamine amidotransferase n=1 Tax=Roseateles toxinivorans TaxID=270368 RepID=A0A4R6QCN9_9BURK|nr:gamma-glutamyl-gamma-aminobutyrate hydrolase family protein [Roseateles toxinivorans]TDP60408.1 putative glutamine amidotransferase [Roseateles toxinivorans]
MNKRPVIGVTPDIEFCPEGSPPRDFYFVDARNVDGLREAGATAVLLPHEADDIDAYLNLLDGLLVTGGGYQFQVPGLFRHDGTEPPEKERRTRFEAALLRRAIERDLAVLAVCGGFQTLNMVTGGDLVVTLGDVRAEWSRHSGPSYTQTVHPVQVVPGTRLAAVTGASSFDVNTRHRQGVLAAGAGAVVSAWSDDGVVEAIEVPGQRFCIGTQWHPEFLLSEPERRLMQAFVRASAA